MKHNIKKRFLRTAGLVFATFTLGFMIWFLPAAYHDFTHVESGENVPNVDWLPEAATNVSYYCSYTNTAYEFDISEKDFRSWSHRDLREIEEPVSITRYTRFTNQLPEPGPNPTDEELEELFRAELEQSATVAEGLYYERNQNNGGGVWIAYNRKLGRAYYRSSPR